MKKYISLVFMAACLAVSCNKNQLPQQSTAIEQAVNANEFTFRVQTANPTAGRTINLTGGYDLVIKPNAIQAALPYFGRAYGPTATGGINFRSTKFRYTSAKTDKGEWDIVIEPEDVPEVQTLRLVVTSEGYGTLYVTSTNRQAISYYGEVLPK